MGACCTKHPNDGKGDMEIIQENNLNNNLDTEHVKAAAVSSSEGMGIAPPLMHPVSELPPITDEVVRSACKRIGEFKWEKVPKYADADIEQVGPMEYVSNGAVYKGQMKHGLRHGAGIQVWRDGSRYEGEWQNDKANGYGRLVHNDGDIYEGQWKNDTACGRGKYYHVQGAIYEGEWVDDAQHGQGREEWPDGTYYEGSYVNGKKEGRGKFNWVDNSFYYGEFRDNNINGKGNLESY